MAQINTAYDTRARWCAVKKDKKRGTEREREREGGEKGWREEGRSRLSTLKNPDIRNVSAMRNIRKSDKSRFHPSWTSILRTEYSGSIGFYETTFLPTG